MTAAAATAPLFLLLLSIVCLEIKKTYLKRHKIADYRWKVEYKLK